MFPYYLTHVCMSCNCLFRSCLIRSHRASHKYCDPCPQYALRSHAAAVLLLLYELQSGNLLGCVGCERR